MSQVKRRFARFERPPLTEERVEDLCSHFLDPFAGRGRRADRVYFDAGPHLEEAIERCRADGIEIVARLPRITTSMPRLPDIPLMISSPGQMLAYSERRLYGSYFLNMFNSINVPELYQSTLSVELSRDDIRDITAHYLGRLEVMVFGRVELMVARDPTLEEGTLIDERGARFPVFRDRCGYVHILNSSDLFLLDFLGEMDRMGIDSYGIDLRNRPPDVCSIVAKAFDRRDLRSKDRIKRRAGPITAGHYLRGVQ